MEALRHESIEFVLVQHPWMENDTLFADIILPVKTVFECSDISSDSLGGQFPLYYIEEVAIDPVGEARSDAEIVADIADRFKQFFRSHARYPSFSSTLRSFPRTRCRITDVLLTVRSQSFAISETGSA